MTGFDFGDVILVPFPFTDQSTTKRRPAVVVSSPAYHRARPDLIILAITSKSRPEIGPLDDAPIERWHVAGLIKPSVLKPILATIEQGLVLRILGRLAFDDRTTLHRMLGTMLGQP